MLSSSSTSTSPRELSELMLRRRPKSASSVALHVTSRRARLAIGSAASWDTANASFQGSLSTRSLPFLSCSEVKDSSAIVACPLPQTSADADLNTDQEYHISTSTSSSSTTTPSATSVHRRSSAPISIPLSPLMLGNNGLLVFDYDQDFESPLSPFSSPGLPADDSDSSNAISLHLAQSHGYSMVQDQSNPCLPLIQLSTPKALINTDYAGTSIHHSCSDGQQELDPCFPLSTYDEDFRSTSTETYHQWRCLLQRYRACSPA